MRYQFTEDLVTGNSLIDSEHRTLIKAADDAMVNISQGKGKESIEKTIKFLADYTKTHFKHEEELQEKSKYPDIVAHKEWHRSFVRELEETAKNITSDGASSVMVIELTRRISALLNHIRTQDKRIALHVAQQG